MIPEEALMHERVILVVLVTPSCGGGGGSELQEGQEEVAMIWEMSFWTPVAKPPINATTWPVWILTQRLCLPETDVRILVTFEERALWMAMALTAVGSTT